MFFFLKRYRSIFKGNIRKTIILGKTPQSESLEKFLVDTPFYGFINKKIICFKDRSKLDIEAIFDYISNEEIDEIFCSISELNNGLYFVKVSSALGSQSLMLVKSE